jgi:hypothetical protein
MYKQISTGMSCPALLILWGGLTRSLLLTCLLRPTVAASLAIAVTRAWASPALVFTA